MNGGDGWMVPDSAAASPTTILATTTARRNYQPSRLRAQGR